MNVPAHPFLVSASLFPDHKDLHFLLIASWDVDLININLVIYLFLTDQFFFVIFISILLSIFLDRIDVACIHPFQKKQALLHQKVKYILTRRLSAFVLLLHEHTFIHLALLIVGVCQRIPVIL